MEQFAFFLIMMIPLAAVLFLERKNAKKYVYLGLFTVVLASIWEPIGVYFGVWAYNAHPQFLGVSMVTILAYFQYVCISYFLADVFLRRVGRK
jgi:hypothetical protein